MTIGMLAWVARYVLFAFGNAAGGPIMAFMLGGIILHGVCYDFFFVAGQIYVDRTFSPATRARAQSILALITQGVGMAIGSLLANAVYVANTTGAQKHEWQTIWLIPAALALATAVVFALVFKDRRTVQMAAPAVAGSEVL
jgi:MFS family permease